MKKTRRRAALRRVAVVAAAALLVAACGSDDDDGADAGSATSAQASADTTSAPSPTSATSEQPATSDMVTPTSAGVAPTTEGAPADDQNFDLDATVRVATTIAPVQWDPEQCTHDGTCLEYYAPVYATLIWGNYDSELVPALAESWEQTDDTLTLTLRSDVTFHDGTTLDAEAVKANFDRYLASENAVVSSKLTKVASVEAVDATTVVMHLNEPDPVLPVSLAMPSLAIASPAAFDTLATHPVGAGPFKYVGQTQDAVQYERFDGYYDPDRVHAAHFEVRGITDANARFNALRTGEIDLAEATAAEHAAIKEFQNDPNFAVHMNDGRAISMLFLNIARPPLDNVDVRRALNYSIDRALIGETLGGGIMAPANQQLRNQPGFVPGLDETYTYDPAKVRELLDQAGVDQLHLRGIISNAGVPAALAPAIQEQMTEAGIDVELVPVEATQARSEFRTNEYDFLISIQVSDPDPGATLLSNVLGTNSPGGTPDDIRELAEAALALEPGTDERRLALEAVNRALVESPMHVPVLSSPSTWIFRKDLVGVEDTPWATMTGKPDFSFLGIVTS